MLYHFLYLTMIISRHGLLALATVMLQLAAWAAPVYGDKMIINMQRLFTGRARSHQKSSRREERICSTCAEKPTMDGLRISSKKSCVDYFFAT